MQGLDLISVTRVNSMMRGLVDVRTAPAELKFLNRLKVVEARDREVMGIYRGYTLIADIISDGQAAVAYESGRVAVTSTNLPNLKHGRKLTEEEIRDIYNLTSGFSSDLDMTMWNNWANANLDDLLLGIRQRMETLAVAMSIDAFNYDRLGVKIEGATWGMLAELKFTSNPGWADADNAKPVTDILYAKLWAQTRWNIIYDRVTMSMSAFNLMIQTDQFQSMARFVLPIGTTAAIIPLQDTSYLVDLAQNLLKMTIEFYDSRYWQQQANGTLLMYPYMPNNIVELSSTAEDKNIRSADFANAVTTESLLGTMLPADSVGMIGKFEKPAFGPIGYGSAGHNPPGVFLWGVGRCWPRKFNKARNATINIGTVEDMFPFTEAPFPS